jgi:hypothetical protein
MLKKNIISNKVLQITMKKTALNYQGGCCYISESKLV